MQVPLPKYKYRYFFVTSCLGFEWIDGPGPKEIIYELIFNSLSFGLSKSWSTLAGRFRQIKKTKNELRPQPRLTRVILLSGTSLYALPRSPQHQEDFHVPKRSKEADPVIMVSQWMKMWNAILTKWFPNFWFEARCRFVKMFVFRVWWKTFNSVLVIR